MSIAVCDHSVFVVMTADNPREEPLEQIFADAMPGLANAGKKARVIPDRHQAILWAIDTSRAGDTILLCGKGHEEYQVLSDRTIFFDEKKIAADLFKLLKEN